jgi:ABC-type microcin C transport system permease subunit YejE
MLKRTLVLLLVLVVVFSFCSAALANGKTAEVDLENGLVYVPYVAKYTANSISRAANNPIEVAGKFRF